MAVPVDLVLPVKALDAAKSRLAGAAAAAGIPAPDRARAHRDLALALAADTLAAVLAAGVRAVVVVSADPRARALGDGSARVAHVDDPGAGLDAAVDRGAAHLRRAARDRGAPDGAVAALLADLPALRPAELDAALDAARAAFATSPAGAAFVADHTGHGTSLLVTRAGSTPRPRFGAASAAAHAALGAVPLAGDWPGLRTDVDTPADLDRARALGLGPATAAWPDRIAAPAGCAARLSPGPAPSPTIPG